MAEEVKFIINKLNEAPFNKGYTLAKFDELSNFALLQVLNDVFAALDEQQQVLLRNEVPEDTAVRMLTFLNTLNYKPKTENVSQFRQGLIQGGREVVHPIMHWLLDNFADLQKRAYLARYLVPFEVPEEFRGQDDDVQAAYETYQGLLEDFKALHRQVQKARKSGFSITEIKRDIKSLDDEKEQLMVRTQRVRKKAEAVPNFEQMLEAAKVLRAEREKEKELQESIREQKNLLLHAEQQHSQTLDKLKSLKNASLGGGAEGLLSRMQEENKMVKFLVGEKLPKAVAEKKKHCEELQKVLLGDAVGDRDIGDLQQQITRLSRETNVLIEKRMVKNDPIDDKLSLFKQQASIIARKKEATADTLKDVTDEVGGLERELAEKREAAKTLEGSKMLKGDEFKKYVTALRTKSNVYKKKKAELAEIRTEFGILTRTEELLRQENERRKREVQALEAKKGIAGYQDAQENLEKVSSLKSDLDDQKGKTLAEISEMVKTLMASISEKKTKLAPVIKELRAKRTECGELEAAYDEQKAAFLNTTAGLDSTRARMEQEVRGLREEAMQEESRFHYLNSMIDILTVQMERVQNELKIYMHNGEVEPGQKKQKSFRELYTRRIQEQDNLAKMLREKQKTVRASHEPNMRQLQLWKSLDRIMQCKMECLQREQQHHRAEMETVNEHQDHLVL